MAAMAPALTDPAPDARNLHFKLAPPSSSLPLGETNGGCLPPPAPPDLVTSYSGSHGKELKLAGVFTPRSILSQSLCRGRSSILEFNLEELRGIANSGRGGLGGPINGLAKRPAKPAVDKPPSLAIPALEPWVKAPPVPPGSPAEENEHKGSRVEHGSDAHLKALLRRHGEMEKRARSIQKRLQLVQAKQVERHFHQQLGGLVGAAFGRSPETPRTRLTVVTRKADAQRRGEAESCSSDAFLKGAAAELERLSCSGTATLRTCERGFDSDATESSSGGDSDVEEEELRRVDTQQSHVPLKRRCEWIWAQERADVVSRWNWLQAHVSDLEYRIRQHTDFYRQLRAGKGQVVLGDASPPESCVEDSLHPSIPNARTSASTSSPDPEKKADEGSTEAKLLQKPINGIVATLPSRCNSELEEHTPSKPTATLVDSSCVCARAKPVLHCKRRRVVRPDRILPLHRKVQRSVPRPCEVSSSCVMCATFPGLSTQFPYSDPLSERLTLLDPAIHPVLSFPADVPAGLQLHSLLRSHNKMDRLRTSKKIKPRPQNLPTTLPETPRTERMPGIFHAHRLTLHRPLPELPPKQHLEPSQRTLKCERTSILKTERSLSLPIPLNKKRHFSPLERDAGRHDVDTGVPCLGSDNTIVSRQLSIPSDGSSSASLSAAAAAARRRRAETSYDIDNIVIPMSVAATTRVERLQYKEILTPSWRVVKIASLSPSKEEDLEELEDLSDAAFTALHAKCEEMERTRWISSSILPQQRRGSRTHRSSEGSVTPQPSIGAQPLTPQPPSPDTSSWQAIPDFSPLSPDILSAPPTPTSRDTPRLLSEETQSSVSDSGFEEITIQPWERRHFPLPYHPKPDPAGASEPTDWGGPRPPRRSSCSSRTAKDPEGPPSSPPCPYSRPRPLHR